MKDRIDEYTWRAIRHHDDGVVEEYYRLLCETKRLHTTRCRACAHTVYPPRPFCPKCFAEEVEWVDVGAEATLYAFTTQQKALRFTAPEVIGVVEIAGVGRILTRIDAPLDALRIGQRMKLAALEISPNLVVHSYAPAEQA